MKRLQQLQFARLVFLSDPQMCRCTDVQMYRCTCNTPWCWHESVETCRSV